MRSKFIGLALSGAIALSGLALSTAVDAAIINIDSTSNTAVQYTFNPGQYLIEFIGTADGGAFNAWNPSCADASCVGGWRDAFSLTTDPGLHPDIDTFFVAGPAYVSPLAALAGFQTSPIQDAHFAWNGSSYVLGSQTQIDQPWIVAPNAPVTVNFFISDATRTDNFGGVSLRITAVPEPQAWSLMILGFAGLGAMLRARRGAGVAATA